MKIKTIKVEYDTSSREVTQCRLVVSIDGNVYVANSISVRSHDDEYSELIGKRVAFMRAKKIALGMHKSALCQTYELLTRMIGKVSDSINKIDYLMEVLSNRIKESGC